MEKQKVTDIAKAREGTCGRCHMMVARYAPQVVAPGGVYHRECYEAWYFGRFRKRPSLLAGVNGDRHRFEVRDKAA
jgi:hypothetical protein